MLYCSKCGTELNEGAKFCHKCGAEIIEDSTKICARCGNERKGTEKFCSQCGTPYVQTPTNNVSEFAGNKSKSSKKGIIVVAIVVVVALLGGSAWYFFGNKNDKYSLEGLAKAAVNYDEVYDFYDGLACVSKGEKVGFIDKMGNEVISCIYERGWSSFFSEGLALVFKDNKKYYIDKEGKKVFDINYDQAGDFSNGRAAVCKDGKWGFIDKSGKEVIKCNYDNAYSFSEGLAVVSKGEKYGYIDLQGTVVIPLIYERLGDEASMRFHEGLAAVCKNGKCGFVDAKGSVIIPFNYQSANYFSEGLASVEKDDKWGVIDKSGNVVIDFSDGYIQPFSEGIAWKEDGEKYVAINKKNVIQFTCKHERVYGFHDGFAVVGDIPDRYTVEEYLVDKQGREYFTQTRQEIRDFSEGLAVVCKDGVWGYIDAKGNSTFDVQNEAIKKIVDVKIRERDEARKEEESRAEEERKRIEEENKPSNQFYQVANQGCYVWQCVNGYFEDIKNYFYWRPNRLFLYFYPSSKQGGKVTVATYYTPNEYFVKNFTNRVPYSVIDDFILFTYKHNLLDYTIEYRLRIDSNNGNIRLVRSDGQIYVQSLIDISDPL